MKTLYKFFKTAEVSQQITIHQKVKVEKYNLVKYLIQASLNTNLNSRVRFGRHALKPYS
jgi:acyl-[acyl carrier protein]--UDP-N-acetylglucosamine O-acyltransferase